MLKGQLKRVRRASKALRAQQRQLLAMELEGLVVLTIHSVTASLSFPLDADTAAQLASLLLETLRERQQHLRREAAELQHIERDEDTSGSTVTNS